MGDELTAAQAAERLGVGRSTVNLWCRQGRFPSARREDSPVGPYWIIPAADLKGFTPPPRGRIPKAKAEQSADKPKGGKAGGPDGHVRVTKKGGRK